MERTPIKIDDTVQEKRTRSPPSVLSFLPTPPPPGIWAKTIQYFEEQKLFRGGQIMSEGPKGRGEGGRPALEGGVTAMARRGGARGSSTVVNVTGAAKLGQ